MADIVTLTINPSIDTSTSVNRVVPVHKLRCAPPHRDPGGGGVNELESPSDSALTSKRSAPPGA